MPTTTHRPELAATQREVIGKKVRVLRRDGKLPAVVFGHGEESLAVSLDAHEFELLRKRTGPNSLIDLSVDGHKSKRVLIHSVQVDPVTRRPLHADLFVVRMKEELTVDVPLVSIGTSIAADKHGGTLIHNVSSIKVRALPDHLPQSIEFSVESLVDFEAAIHVRDLVLPSGVTMLTDPDEVVAKVLPPRVEEVEARPAEEEAEAGEAEGEGAGQAEGSGSES